MEKKAKPEKYYEAKEVEKILKNILDSCQSFSYYKPADIQVLFKKGKNKLNKKHVNIKIIKQPISLSTSKKLILLVTDDWFNENIDSDRVKGIIEGLLGVTTDEYGEYVKRDPDVVTYSEILNDPKYDYSEFGKILPAEKKPDNLVLKPE